MLKTIFTIFISLCFFTEKTDAEVRSRKRKTRGYRAGILDPIKMLESNRTFTAMDARRGSIETDDVLPEIEWYVNTLWTFENRDLIEKKFYKREDLDTYDHFLKNLTELSREMHDFYISDPDTWKYQKPESSYLILFGRKDDENALYWGSRIGERLEELNNAGVIPCFVDTHIDDIVGATYGRYFNPHLFFVYNETQTVYGWEF